MVQWSCLFGHSSEWTRVCIAGVWYRQCERCQQPTIAILVNKEASAITPARVPAIRPRHAVIEKIKKVRKPRKPADVLQLKRKSA